jgi:hypothetical protein
VQQRRRRQEALGKDLNERLDLWLAAGRYRQVSEAIEAMPATDGDEERRGSWLAYIAFAAAGRVVSQPRRTSGPGSVSPCCRTT